MSALVSISSDLAGEVDALSFRSVAFVYNPLVYARSPHEAYLRKWGSKAPRELLLLGINPGPFGMAQTGVPFGDVAMVCGFLGITGVVTKPPLEHPRRPISGFECPHSEVSGTRLWGWARNRFKTADRFFRHAFVANWCPLVFMDGSGRNVTPDKLSESEQADLFPVCDDALKEIVAVLRPTFVVGVGRLAEARARAAALPTSVKIGWIPHPSPANPASECEWSRGGVDERLRELGFDPS